MDNNLRTILNTLFEALQAQQKTINDLTKQIENLHTINKGQDKYIDKCIDRIDILECGLSDLENLDFQVNNNEEELECLESRFMEYKEISGKELTQAESMIEGNETRLYALESKNPASDTINQIIKLLLEGETI